MGAYPQGNRKARTSLLIQLGHLPYYKGEDHRYWQSPRPDRYKSYRARRKFKRTILTELLDEQRSRYMRTFEEVCGEK